MSFEGRQWGSWGLIGQSGTTRGHVVPENKSKIFFLEAEFLIEKIAKCGIYRDNCIPQSVLA